MLTPKCQYVSPYWRSLKQGPQLPRPVGDPVQHLTVIAGEREEPEESITYKVKQTREKKKHNKTDLRLEDKSCEGIRNGGCQAGADPIK